ncbi:MAG: hypothetical protein QOH48_847 [Actinomycetota bacterium]|nr:hypothetical protein [Actinomycetota bacterium]
MAALALTNEGKRSGVMCLPKRHERMFVESSVRDLVSTYRTTPLVVVPVDVVVHP